MAYKLLFFFAFIFSSSFYACLLGQEYIKPLELKPALSGSFGEVRPNHFHTGLDYKTDGHIGVPVLAIADGYLYRVGVSHVGYGKVLYINHANGTTSVYGHLDRFSPRLDSAVMAAHYVEKSFWMNHEFTPEQVHVRKGEVIAYSGNTGSSGGPHLHFELRETKTEKPFNPQLVGFELFDEMRPHLEGVLVSAIKDNGVIGSSNRDRWLPTVFYGDKYHIKGTSSISAWGDIGIGFSGFDYISGDWSKCGIFKVQLLVDDVLIYEHILDTLDFRTLRCTNTFIDYAYLQRKGKTIQKCYVDMPNNSLKIYSHLQKEGIITIDEARKYHLQLKLYDFKSNCADLEFVINGVKAPIEKMAIDSSYSCFKWNQANEYRDTNIVFAIPDSALFENMNFKVEKERSELFLSDIFSVGNNSIALNRYCKLKIKPTECDIPTSKLSIVKVSSTNRIIDFQKTEVDEDGFLSADIRYFGRYAISLDTISPYLISLDLNGKTTISAYKNIQFKCSDRSGITRIDGYIDDKWVLFDYNPKKNLLTHVFDKNRITKGKEHRLLLEVEDGVGNVAKYTKVFVW